METAKYRIVSTASNNVLKCKTSPDYIEESRCETLLCHRPAPRNKLSMGRHLATQKLQQSPEQLQNACYSSTAKLN